MGSSKNRWKITFFPKPPPSPTPGAKPPPNEFICPISHTLMADPVIVTSGQTLDRNCVQVCKNLNFTPFLSSESKPDFSTVIPNIALKSTILKWCDSNRLIRPTPISLNVAEKLVQALMASNSGTESNRRPSHVRFSSEESVSSSPEVPSSEEEEKIFTKLKSCGVFQQGEAVIMLRKVTRDDPTVRIPLCTPRVLSALGSFFISRVSVLQVNSIAALVNLSLEIVNKVKIVRSGLVPNLVEVLKFGYPESVEYSVSLLFSLALDDQNRTAIGVLGGLGPLLRLVKSENQRVGREAVLALYHLSLVGSNLSKLVKLGAVPILLNLLKSVNFNNLASSVLHILCNLAMCPEGRATMLDADAVKVLVELARENELELTMCRDKCVDTLYRLSYGNLRFRGLAKQARAVEVLREVVERGSVRVGEKAKRMLALMNEESEGEKNDVGDVDWESLLFDSGAVSRSHFRLGYGLDSSDGSYGEAS